MALGEFAQAQQTLLQAANSSFGWTGEHDVNAMLADLAVLRRDPAMLWRYAGAAEENAAHYDHMLYKAIAQRAWGVLHHLEGRHAEAAERLHQALALAREAGGLWQIGRTLFELGDLARSSGDPHVCRERFQEALAAFEAIRAVPDIARIRQLLAEP